MTTRKRAADELRTIRVAMVDEHRVGGRADVVEVDLLRAQHKIRQRLRVASERGEPPEDRLGELVGIAIAAVQGKRDRVAVDEPLGPQVQRRGPARLVAPVGCVQHELCVGAPLDALRVGKPCGGQRLAHERVQRLLGLLGDGGPGVVGAQIG